MTVKTDQKNAAAKADEPAKKPAADKVKQTAAAKADEPAKPTKQPTANKPKGPVKAPVKTATRASSVGKAKSAAKKTAKPVANGSGLSLKDAWAPFKADHLEKERQCSLSTLASYEKDFERFMAFIGPDKLVTKITAANVLAFSKSPHLLNKAMDPKKKLCAQPTVKKTLRLAKMFLDWLAAKGHISKAPIPKDLAMGSRSENERKVMADARAKAKAEQERAAQAESERLARADAKAQEIADAAKAKRNHGEKQNDGTKAKAAKPLKKA